MSQLFVQTTGKGSANVPEGEINRQNKKSTN